MHFQGNRPTGPPDSSSTPASPYPINYQIDNNTIISTSILNPKNGSKHNIGNEFRNLKNSKDSLNFCVLTPELWSIILPITFLF